MMTMQILIERIQSVAKKCKDVSQSDVFYNHAAITLYEFANALTTKFSNQLNNDITNFSSEERKDIKMYLGYFSASFGILDFDDIKIPE